MTVIGLTGYISSGKSTVSEHLSELGLEVIDADKIARFILEPGQEGYLKVLREFGLQYLKMDGTIDRKKLGQDVFSSKIRLKMLNDITHPLIVEKIKENLKSAHTEYVIIDAPLLKQVGLDKLCDEVWIITVDRDIQLKRLLLRDDLTRQEALDRIESQEKIEISEKDIVFENNGSVTELLYKVDRHLKELGYEEIS